MSNGFNQHSVPAPLDRLLDYPWLTLAMVAAVLIACGTGLRGVSKEPSVDAFVPTDHPAAVARDMARELFGLEDPMIVALAAPEGESAFTPARLTALRRADEAVRNTPGVQRRDVVSLASENALRGEDGDLLVEPILEPGPITADTAALAIARYRAMPMLSRLLASPAEDMLVIIAPVDDPNHAGETVDAAIAAVRAAVGDAFEVHVAGVAAMNARLAEMVDTDTRIFVPAAIVTVLCLMFVAMRSAGALLAPLIVIAGSAAMAIGLMGWVGARYYLITTALPVVIMAIAVADTLHISAFYMKTRAEHASITAREAVRIALAHTWLPVTLTSITTIAAFVGLSFGAAMRPISEFGLFAAAGVAAAWWLSLTALPAVLILRDVQPPRALRESRGESRLEAAFGRITRGAFLRPRIALAVALATIAGLALLAGDARFDYERQRYFTTDDAVRRSDQAINARLGGINFLDVVVASEQPGGLLTPEGLREIARLRAAIARLPLVVKVSGIDEYIAQMHGALTGAAQGALPSGARAPAQYMFLYEASAPPEDFKQEIDYDHQRALLRAQLATDRYSETRPTVQALTGLVSQWQNQTGLTAQVSGRVAVNEGWMSRLADTHFIGLGLATLLVLLTAFAVFRSAAYALLAVTPLGVGVLAVYATMGGLGIDIAPATSMTAAIATGLGVDFGIHLISHIRRHLADGAALSDALSGHYSLVARACFYSAVALGIALAVLCISSAPPLRWFGLLVSVGAFGSLVGALLIIPALLASTRLVHTRRLQHA